MAKFNILSLDGGGAWALIQVKALQKIYGTNERGHNVLGHFDLVAANSGGSITLGGLIENLTLDDLLQNYFLNEAKRRQVFHKVDLGEDLGNLVYKIIGIAPRYSTPAKLLALQAQLPRMGGIKMSNLPAAVSAARKPHVLIFGFDYDRQRATFFRSNTGSLAGSMAAGLDPTLAEAIHASSTAPVRYFDAPAEFESISGVRYWDGAVGGYNNPALAAVIEALASDKAATDIQVLSIGTGSVRLRLLAKGETGDPVVIQQRQTPGPANDVRELSGAIIDDPPDAATFIAHVVLGQPLPKPGGKLPISGSVIRMSPMVQPVRRRDGSWGPPIGLSDTEFNDLANLDMDAVEQPDVLKIAHLASQWIADKVVNQPIRSNSSDFSCEIAHATFSAACQAWLALNAPAPPAPGTPVA